MWFCAYRNINAANFFIKDANCFWQVNINVYIHVLKRSPPQAATVKVRSLESEIYVTDIQ